MSNIIINNTNKGKMFTCGSCKHSDNNIGFVALHCDLLYNKQKEGEEFEDGKVRSWNKCVFKPSKWEANIR